MRGVTPQFESSEDAIQSLRAIHSRWADVSDVLTKAFRWLRVANSISGQDEERLRAQLSRMDLIVAAVHAEIEHEWREEWP